MRYISTRGQAESADFSNILLEGLASDGGLFCPTAWPHLSIDQLKSFVGLPYHELAAQVLSLFAPEISIDTWRTLTSQAYRAEAFSFVREGSDANKIFPLRPLSDGLSLLELSNGPTLAFKDAAMQLLGHLLSWALEKRGETLTILGATSGDTGSAAIHALRGKSNIRVAMLSPAGRMSAFQRAQMYAVMDSNIMNIAVEGMFDDCQNLVKNLNNDAAFKKQHHLGAVNSINWARIAAQSVYYVTAYLQAVQEIGQPVSFVVPSGNFGNAYAGFVAKQIGLPIDRLIVATNENDVLHETLQTGCYTPRAKAQETSSPSMDISKASNFERALFDAAGRDCAVSAKMQEKLAQEGRINLSQDFPDVWARLQTFGLSSSKSTHADRLNMIREAHQRWGIVIDPHTADALKGALDHQKKGEQMIVLETAQAAKFATTIEEALSLTPPSPTGLGDLLSLPQRVTTIEADDNILKSLINNWEPSS